MDALNIEKKFRFDTAKNLDKFLTRDHRTAFFDHEECEGIYILRVEDCSYYYLDDGSVFDPFGCNIGEKDLDIIKQLD